MSLSLPAELFAAVIPDRYTAELEARTAIGVEKYGEYLHPFNGRDQLQDATEEQLDFGQYIICAMLETTDLQRLERLLVILKHSAEIMRLLDEIHKTEA